MATPEVTILPASPLPCPACAETIARVQRLRSDARCTCGVQYEYRAPRRSTPSAKERRAPVQRSRDAPESLKRVLSDLDAIERWERRARYGSTLQVLSNFAEHDTDPAREWDSLNRETQEQILARLRATPGVNPESLRDPDWSRARELQRKLRTIECTSGLARQGAVLRFLQSHASADDVHAPEGLYVRVGWEFANAEARTGWRKAGFVPPGERPWKTRKRSGRPRRAVIGKVDLDTAKPEGWGRSQVLAAIAAWTDGVGECGKKCAECHIVHSARNETTCRRAYSEEEETWVRDTCIAEMLGICDRAARQLIVDWIAAAMDGYGSRVPKVRKRSVCLVRQGKTAKEEEHISVYEVESSSLHEWDSLRRAGVLTAAGAL